MRGESWAVLHPLYCIVSLKGTVVRLAIEGLLIPSSDANNQSLLPPIPRNTEFLRPKAGFCFSLILFSFSFFTIIHEYFFFHQIYHTVVNLSIASTSDFQPISSCS